MIGSLMNLGLAILFVLATLSVCLLPLAMSNVFIFPGLTRVGTIWTLACVVGGSMLIFLVTDNSSRIMLSTILGG